MYELKGSLRKFRTRFAALEQVGLCRADWDAGVLFVPAVLAIEPPDNQSVVLGWKVCWSEIPDCKLKRAATAVFAEHFRGRGTVFLEAFQEVCAESQARSGAHVYHSVSGTVCHTVTVIRSRSRSSVLRLRSRSHIRPRLLPEMVAFAGLRI